MEKERSLASKKTSITLSLALATTAVGTLSYPNNAEAGWWTFPARAIQAIRFGGARKIGPEVVAAAARRASTLGKKSVNRYKGAREFGDKVNNGAKKTILGTEQVLKDTLKGVDNATTFASSGVKSTVNIGKKAISSADLILMSGLTATKELFNLGGKLFMSKTGQLTMLVGGLVYYFDWDIMSWGDAKKASQEQITAAKKFGNNMIGALGDSWESMNVASNPSQRKSVDNVETEREIVDNVETEGNIFEIAGNTISNWFNDDSPDTHKAYISRNGDRVVASNRALKKQQPVAINYENAQSQPKLEELTLPKAIDIVSTWAPMPASKFAGRLWKFKKELPLHVRQELEKLALKSIGINTDKLDPKDVRLELKNQGNRKVQIAMQPIKSVLTSQYASKKPTQKPVTKQTIPSPVSIDKGNNRRTFMGFDGDNLAKDVWRNLPGKENWRLRTSIKQVCAGISGRVIAKIEDGKAVKCSPPLRS